MERISGAELGLPGEAPTWDPLPHPLPGTPCLTPWNPRGPPPAHPPRTPKIPAGLLPLQEPTCSENHVLARAPASTLQGPPGPPPGNTPPGPTCSENHVLARSPGGVQHIRVIGHGAVAIPPIPAQRNKGQEMQRLPMCMGSGIAPPPLRMVPSPPAALPTHLPYPPPNPPYYRTCPRRRKCWAHLALIFS